MNEGISDREVRLIDEQGTQLGVMSKAEAQRIADFRNLDLVNISPNTKPAVCKLMNYGKYRFDMIKKEKEAKKAQKIIDIKEICLSQTIDVGDVNTKAKHAREFLTKGDKVKVSLKMRGRQQAHPELSIEVLNKFFELLKDVAVMEKKPTSEGRQYFMMLSSINKKI